MTLKANSFKSEYITYQSLHILCDSPLFDQVYIFYESKLRLLETSGPISLSIIAIQSDYL